MTVDSPWQIFVEQFEIMLIFLARPIVQRQLVALAVILLLAWFLPEGVRAWLGKTGLRSRTNGSQPRWRRWLIALYHLYSPILSLILVNLTIWLFIQLGYPAGLLAGSRRLFWIWLAYRALLTILYATFGQASRPYHRWILLPIFIWVVASRILESLVGIHLLADIQIFSIFGVTITLGNLFAALVVLYWLFVAAWLIEAALYKSLGPRINVDPGLVNTVTTMSRYVVIAVGVLLALRTLGVDLSTLAIIGGGLSIGVGFGLQQIIANFISGIVLLFEQSLRPGDVIDIEGEIGVVEKLDIRSTIVRTNDNVEVIVPNETFLTSQVTTFTRTERKVRIRVPFGVSYESNPH